MSDDEDIAALVVDNGSGMCKGEWRWWKSHTHDTIDRGHFVFELFDFFIIREWDACILPCRYSNGYDMAGPWILSVPYVHRLPIIMFVLADSTKRMERWLIDYGFIVWRSARARLDKCRSSSSSTLKESILLLWHFHIDTFLVIMRVLFVDFCRFYFISSVAHYFCLKHLKKSNSVFKLTNGTENKIETMKHSP